MRGINEIRRENLFALVAEAGSQANLARLIDKDPNQVSQWLGYGEPRNLSTNSARNIESVCSKPQGWMDQDHGTRAAKGSQSLGLDTDKLTASINFLEQQFALWGREFNAPEQTLLIAGVYERLMAVSAPNLVELSRWLGDQLKEKDDDRQSETGSTGRDDRRRDQRRAAAS